MPATCCSAPATSRRQRLPRRASVAAPLVGGSGRVASSGCSPGRCRAARRPRPTSVARDPDRVQSRPLESPAGRHRSGRPVSPWRPGRRGRGTVRRRACASPWSPVTTTASDARRLPLHLGPTGPPGRAARPGRPGTPRGADPGRRSRFRPAGSSASSPTCSASCRSDIPSPAAWSSTSTGPRAGIRCATTPGAAADGRRGRSFPFVPVEGTGVYEIPVGPVHAGLIEPGHFRFWVVGETILRMKARLWFVHKGIERLFEGQDAHQALSLAERISGDTAVGHGLAYCLAVEDAWQSRSQRTPASCAPCCSSWSGSTTTSPTSAHSATTSASGSPRPGRSTLREQLLRLNRDDHRPPPAARRRDPRWGARPPPAHTGPSWPRSRALRASWSSWPPRTPSSWSGSRRRRCSTVPTPRTSASSVWPAGHRASPSTPASPIHSSTPVEGSSRRSRPTATSWRAFGSGSTRCGPRCRLLAHYVEAAGASTTWRLPRSVRRVRPSRRGSASSRAGAAPSCTGSSSKTGTAGPGQGGRPVVPQLAGAAGVAGRHDRPRLPARQQELQPLLCRERPLMRSPVQVIGHLINSLDSQPCRPHRVRPADPAQLAAREGTPWQRQGCDTR